MLKTVILILSIALKSIKIAMIFLLEIYNDTEVKLHRLRAGKVLLTETIH